MTDGSSTADKIETADSLLRPWKWPARHSVCLLTLATLAWLLPFSGKALHMDDPLFVWTAQHIAQHPGDPYGFQVVWYATETPIADITKNPPLASYYAAVAGSLFGWSERALHLAFLVPALGVVLGTYLLARRFTQAPLLAAAATLLAPGFLVSGTTLMCDVLMLALWIFAMIFWLQGTDSGSQWQLLVAALLIAACALTKYFGVSLIPLLLVYSLSRKRRLHYTFAYLGVPVLVLTLYQYWTHELYGRGLLSDAVQYASFHNRGHEPTPLAKALVGLAFAGGCAAPAFFFAPWLWKRRWIFVVLVISGFAGLSIAGHQGWFDAPQATARWPFVSVQMAGLLAGGLSVLGLAGARLSRKIGADRLLLSFWVAGTFFFATFVNWTVNARSILPMIPAAGILIAHQLEADGFFVTNRFAVKVGTSLVASGALSLWVAWADTNLANAGRAAANRVRAELGSAATPLYFQGHWGFQYYMQKLGANPADVRNSRFRAGDVMVIPENTTNSFGPPPGFTLAGRIMAIELNGSLATMSQPMGAGFYASVWGPLPFAVGTVPPERYLIAQLGPLAGNSASPVSSAAPAAAMIDKSSDAGGMLVSGSRSDKPCPNAPGLKRSEPAVDEQARGEVFDGPVDVTKTVERHQQTHKAIGRRAQPVEIAPSGRVAHEQHDPGAAVERGEGQEVEYPKEQIEAVESGQQDFGQTGLAVWPVLKPVKLQSHADQHHRDKHQREVGGRTGKSHPCRTPRKPAFPVRIERCAGPANDLSAEKEGQKRNDHHAERFPANVRNRIERQLATQCRCVVTAELGGERVRGFVARRGE